jgi:hypothetical protein
MKAFCMTGEFMRKRFRTVRGSRNLRRTDLLRLSGTP